MTKNHSVTITAGVSVRAGVRGKGFRAGVKRAFCEFKHYLNRQWNRGGAWVQVEQVVDREANRYAKKVVVIETGEIIRDVNEPLTQHRRHNPGEDDMPRVVDPD